MCKWGIKGIQRIATDDNLDRTQVLALTTGDERYDGKSKKEEWSKERMGARTQ